MWRGGWHGHVEWGGVRIGENNGGVGSRWWGGGAGRGARLHAGE